MKSREEISVELLKYCMTVSLKDDQKMATAVQQGDTREAALSAVPESDRWSKTYLWMAESLKDHQNIAAAIQRGDSREAILSMPEADRWPETYVWLEGKL